MKPLYSDAAEAAAGANGGANAGAGGNSARLALLVAAAGGGGVRCGERRLLRPQGVAAWLLPASRFAKGEEKWNGAPLLVAGPMPEGPAKWPSEGLRVALRRRRGWLGGAPYPWLLLLLLVSKLSEGDASLLAESSKVSSSSLGTYWSQT